MFRKIFTLVTICTAATVFQAQDDHLKNINLQAAFLYEVPGADLAKRYGPDTKFEFKLEFLSDKLFAAYVKGGLRINQNVKEDVLSTIRTKDGFVIGVNGFYADVFGRKRGYDLGVGADKLIPVGMHYLRVGLSGAYITHWVKIVDDSQSVAQVQGVSAQLYDRFVSGFGVEENIQLQYKSQFSRAIFLFGFQAGQFFSREHRHELIGNEAKERRLDLYFGAKVAYMLPLYTFSEASTIYY